MPSGKPSDQSNEAREQESEDSVFDFLYYDVSRIASFLSQFDSSGHLTELRQSQSAYQRTHRSGTVEVKGSILAASALGKDELRTENNSEKSNQKSYDPRWVNALSFLDYLEDAHLLNRDLTHASIGQLVLFTGDLSLFDLSILKSLWSLPAAKNLLITGATQSAQQDAVPQNRRERRLTGPETKQKKNEAEAAVEMLTILPHSVQAAVSKADQSVWCTLREENLTVAPSDLFMKHGLSIDGEWAIVGILDAYPDDGEQEADEDGISISLVKQMMAGVRLGGFATIFGPQFAPAIRQMLGRPSAAHGFTPLLIFREIAR
ncbi:hypothetical protein RU07_12470 [Agrobacterium tumefaciens]|uniref:Uncharacterized protein n=1 Tax=Agrobacterium tumefaciens TaxID=358 RepID=A0A0D0J8M4_AGRTU|nr:hypothetical protein RU07_12470 [Agrobacterium tumefaciens]